CTAGALLRDGDDRVLEPVAGLIDDGAFNRSGWLLRGGNDCGDKDCGKKQSEPKCASHLLGASLFCGFAIRQNGAKTVEDERILRLWRAGKKEESGNPSRMMEI